MCVCYAMLCCAVLCCAVLYCAMLCYAVLCYALLCYGMLCYAVLCYVVPCYAMLCCVAPCYARGGPGRILGVSGGGLGRSRVFLEWPQGVFSRSVKTMFLTLRVFSDLGWVLGVSWGESWVGLGGVLERS